MTGSEIRQTGSKQQAKESKQKIKEKGKETIKVKYGLKEKEDKERSVQMIIKKLLTMAIKNKTTINKGGEGITRVAKYYKFDDIARIDVLSRKDNTYISIMSRHVTLEGYGMRKEGTDEDEFDDTSDKQFQLSKNEEFQIKTTEFLKMYEKIKDKAFLEKIVKTKEEEEETIEEQDANEVKDKIVILPHLKCFERSNYINMVVIDKETSTGIIEMISADSMSIIDETRTHDNRPYEMYLINVRSDYKLTDLIILSKGFYHYFPIMTIVTDNIAFYLYFSTKNDKREISDEQKAIEAENIIDTLKNAILEQKDQIRTIITYEYAIAGKESF